jgi:hypothetical protein
MMIGVRTISKMKRRGLSLLESMMMLTVLAVIGVATGVGLQAASKVPPANDRILIIDAQLNSDMDYWHAYAFSSSSPWPSTLPYTKNDTVPLIIGGKTVSLSRTTTISKWDPNDLTNNASPQNDFVKVVVTIDGQSITFYMSALL